MWKKIDRHIRAGGLAGVVLPAIVSGILFFSAPEWRSPLVLWMIILLGLMVGVVAGGLIRGIEKSISRRIPVLLSIILALVASLFITAVFTFAQ